MVRLLTALTLPLPLPLPLPLLLPLPLPLPHVYPYPYPYPHPYPYPCAYPYPYPSSYPSSYPSRPYLPLVLPLRPALLRRLALTLIGLGYAKVEAGGDGQLVGRARLLPYVIEAGTI